jgi:signal transduction histidine kinase/CheY-like chemotaxis protein
MPELKESNAHFESELRISPRPVLVLLLVSGLIFYMMADMWANPAEALNYELFWLLLCVLSAVGWLLTDWNRRVGRWFTILALAAAVHLVNFWLGLPGSLALAVIPTALAAALISLHAATIVAFGETMLLAGLSKYGTWGLDPPAAGATLAAVWAILGVMVAVYRPVRQVAHRSSDHFQQAQSFLEKARANQAELKQALDDLARANLQLTRMNVQAQGLRQAAEDARLAKEQFVANVSHELRTPLNMIIGFSEMIVQSPETYSSKIPPALLADLTIIYRNAQHLAALVDDVLDLSQIEADQMALSKEYVSFDEIAEAATVAVRPLFESKELYLIVDSADDLPPIFCDRTRIREVLLNLLSNAGRFTECGGVCMRAWREGNDLVVTVADTGAGIAAKDIGKLFQPFQQVDASIRRRYGGTGLGLSISKRFIELHGGKIWVESEEGSGTTFFFHIPLAPPTPMSSDFSRWLNPQWEYVERTRPSMAPKTVVRPRFIVLEAGDVLQRLLTRYLDGAEIVPVTSLEEAFRELSTSPSQAFLINDMSVSGALQHLEATTLPYGTPVMVCSVPGVSESTDALGISDYLVKPVSRDDLLAALDRLDLGGKTVLIVDDEPDALRLFRRMLASAERDYRVLRARDGREALDILREQRPDAMLIDLVMPNMDGFQLLEAKSQDPALRDIPAIVVSARDPAGQPIVSNALAVMCRGGLSAHRLLTCIKSLSETLSTIGQPAGLTLTAVSSG